MVQIVMYNELPVDGPMLKLKSEELAKKLTIPDFKASTGWLDNFKTHHGISFKKIQGEVNAVRQADTDDWLNRCLPELLKSYDLDSIYNADETGLFWQALSDRTMVLKGDWCEGGKRIKTRINVLVASNATGTERDHFWQLGNQKT